MVERATLGGVTMGSKWRIRDRALVSAGGLDGPAAFFVR
jgi:hypothetical protein